MNDQYNFQFASALLEQEDYDQLWRYALPHASAGDSNAQCLVSLLWQSGLGVPPDLDEAERWLRKATEQNNPVAWNNLGTLLMMKGENDEAKRCLQKAAELGFNMRTSLSR